jgi:superfamily II DNA or RNA helicase
MSIKLRDYQESAIDAVRAAFRLYRSLLLVLSTGAGKTVIFSFIARAAAEKGRKVLILAHRDQLIKQASRKLRDYGVKHGIIMAGYTPDPVSRVQVASVQTMVRRIKKIRFKPDMIIIDEAHLSAAKSYRDILAAYPDALVLGVTGSPCRLDNQPLGKEHGGIYEFMIEGVSIKSLIERGFLVRPKVYGAERELDLSGVKKSMGDYNTEQLAAVVDKPKITGDAVKMYQTICPGAPAVAWCVTVEHATHVAEAFNSAGVRAEMLCGEHDSAHRDRVLAALDSGEVQVVTFVGILIEGVDCPAISAILMLRPTLSLSSYLQVIGRGLRPYTNRLGVVKDCCYVLDHASLWKRHGFADEEREWSLEVEVKQKGSKKKQAEPSDAVQCKACFAVFVKAPVCPCCGHVVEQASRSIEHVDGDLKEITPEMIEAIRRGKKSEVKGAKSLEELERIGAERGYSAGWAKATWAARARTREKYRPARPAEPSLAELKAMSLEELESVASQQGWPRDFPSEFYYSQGAGVDLFNQKALGGQ